jgi:uncharacterized protein (DUF1501 family)
MTRRTDPPTAPAAIARIEGLSRRHVLAAATAWSGAVAWPTLSLAGAGSPGGARFVFVVLRGGMDGLSAAPATGDPAFAAARGPLAQFGAAPLPVDATFSLHPELAALHAMVVAGEASVVHAVGLPYRERSHFDAQQVLESGGARPYELSTGWLGRALAAGGRKGVALNTTVPLVLRGGAEIDTWSPSALPDPSRDLVDRLERMYAGDPALATALDRARRLHLDGVPMAGAPDMTAGGPRPGAFLALSRRAADFLVQANGPQAAVLEIGGWDTHANQANPNGPLALGLRALDAGLAALRAGLVAGGAWDRTVVVVTSEFGREVAVNGTLGTDHGTGGVAFVLGGAIQGAGVVADWPGLARSQRHEGRDLRITTDLRAVLKGVLGDHLKIASRTLEGDVFPGSGKIVPLSLLRTVTA